MRISGECGGLTVALLDILEIDHIDEWDTCRTSLGTSLGTSPIGPIIGNLFIYCTYKYDARDLAQTNSTTQRELFIDALFQTL